MESPAGATDPALLEQLRVLATVRAVARSNAVSDQQAPRFWGHLRVLEPIGRGAFGDVYRAWDTRLDREVALKLLPIGSASAESPSSVIEEGRLLARVRHPNVVTIYGAERIGDRIGLWMEFVRGRTLEQMLRSGTVFSPTDVGRLGLDLCRAVAAVHATGLLHRDIKAQNVMVADDGRLVLMDFGTGQELRDACAGGAAGTPLYLAPEVLDGNAPTVRSDIYSVGVLFYHLLTGVYPVRATTLAELRSAHARGARVDLPSLRRDVPRRLAHVIERAISRNTGDRYRSADALGTALATIGASSRFSRATTVAAVALVIVLVIGGGWLLQRRFGSERIAPATVPSMTSGATPVLSLPGETFQPALSPDGTELAFVWARAYEASLYVNRLGAEAIRQLTPANAAFPAWSPDGRSIAFRHRLTDARKSYAISVVSASGGPHRTVWSGELIVGRGLDWSPDGAHLLFSARTSDERDHRVLRLAIGTGAIDWLTSAGADESYAVFSPDGHGVAFVRSSGDQPGIYLLRLDAREPKRLMAAQSPLKRLAWSVDGQSLFFASEGAAGNERLWKIRLRDGHVEPVPGTTIGAMEPSVAKGAGQLVFLQTTLDRNLYRASAGSRSPIEQFPGTIRSETHPDISPDGSRVAFASDRTGASEIWTVDPRGGDLRAVTMLKSVARHPRWAPDGRRLAFVALEAVRNNHDIYVIDASGSGLRRLTEEPSTEQWPTWSRDGKWIYFTSDRTGTWQIWKIAEGGGAAHQLTVNGGFKAWESHDGRFLLYSDETGIRRMPVAGGPAERLFDFPYPATWGGEWVPTHRGLFVLSIAGARRATFERFDFSTGRTSTVLTVPGLYDNGSGFTISRDGTWLVYSQRDVARSEIMLMR